MLQNKCKFLFGDFNDYVGASVFTKKGEFIGVLFGEPIKKYTHWYVPVLLGKTMPISFEGTNYIQLFHRNNVRIKKNKETVARNLAMKSEKK